MGTILEWFNGISGGDFVLATLLLVAIWYFAQLVVWLCADIGILWVSPKEGTAVAVMRNKKFHKMLLRYTGHRFAGNIEGGEPADLGQYEIVVDETSKVISALISIIFPIYGVSWIGIPPYYDIHRYKLEWMDDRFQQREPEEIGWVLVQQYVYGVILDNIELGGAIPYKIKLLITLRVTNPAKALFRVRRYLDATMERLSGWARGEFSNLTSDDFIAPSDSGEKKEGAGERQPSIQLERALQRILDSARTQITPAFGVTVDTIQIRDIDPSSDELREITIMEEKAKKGAAAAIATARGEAKAIKIVNKAAEKMGKNAMTLKGYHAIENAKANVTLVGKDLDLSLMLQVPSTKKEGESQ